MVAASRCSPAGDADSELAGLAREVLPVARGRSPSPPDRAPGRPPPGRRGRGHLEGLGPRGPLASHHHPHHVVGLDREAVDGVDGVGQAEARRVVLGESEGRGLDLCPRGPRAHEARAWRTPGPKSAAGRPSGRGQQVLLHERGRQREHVAVVVEAVARVVLGEVVGGPEVARPGGRARCCRTRCGSAPGGDAAGVRGAGVRPRQRRSRSTRPSLPLRLGDGREARRGHHSRAHLLDDLLPGAGVGHDRRLPRVGREVQLGVLDARVVAGVAAPGEDRLDRGVECGRPASGRSPGR